MKEKILKKPVPKGYIDTLDYGLVPIRYKKEYLMNCIDCVETADGRMFDIYVNTTGILVAYDITEELLD